jgi:hypothetical protein
MPDKVDTFAELGVQPPDKRVMGGVDSLTPQPIGWVTKMAAVAATEPVTADFVVRNPLHTSANYDKDWNR